MAAKHSSEQVIDQIKEAGHHKVKVAAVDIDGILRGKYMNLDKFASAVRKGFGFCNVVLGWDSGDVCYDNVEYTGWHTGFPDAQAVIDLATERAIPWDARTPFFLAEFQDAKGQPLPECPRQLLKKVVGKADTMGFKTVVGCEYEWFNFKETPESLVQKGFSNLSPLTPGMFGYSLLRTSQHRDFFNALMDQLREFRIPLEGLHAETGPGVYEAAIACADALEAADRAVLLKTAVKEIATKHGITATFMARWNTSLPGCSGHIHQSLLDHSGRPVFWEEQDRHKMSDVFKSFLAGQLLCMPDLLPMMAPTVNSYKRLVEGYWAPTRAAWGLDNRTTALRVIMPHAGAARVECRTPGADMNAYLAVAASLASGLYGVEHKLRLDQVMVQGSAYEDHKGERFPVDLWEAATRFGQSELAIKLFGEAFVKHFAKTREWEWRQYHKAVSDWELKRYLEII